MSYRVRGLAATNDTVPPVGTLPDALGRLWCPEQLCTGAYIRNPVNMCCTLDPVQKAKEVSANLTALAPAFFSSIPWWGWALAAGGALLMFGGSHGR